MTCSRFLTLELLSETIFNCIKRVSHHLKTMDLFLIYIYIGLHVYPNLWLPKKSINCTVSENSWISPLPTVLEQNSKLDKWGKSQTTLKRDNFHSAAEKGKVSAFSSSEWFRLPLEKTDECFLDLWFFSLHIKYRLCNMYSEPLWKPNHTVKQHIKE